ncbi:hypothetical protein Glove_347g12 [Diversispora epigaea]|uniref:Uncharacterized protein n=1 Tax=Diversispora epigaea TaxID=1348612 RepID=A0A397HEL2_9GLOM|nr:hypothetical protein Glove_347g12 [Diversispora epigaea]
MSSYKTDSKTGLPVKYLKDTKKVLWEKFSHQLPDGIKRSTFFTFLEEDLGGLCSICNRYGYEIFAEMKQFVEKNIQNQNYQKYYINEIENLCRYLKKFYEQEFKISINRTVIHNEYISHCLLYAFGTCKEAHNNECTECGKLFTIFNKLKMDIPTILHNELDEKVYLNSQFNANLLELNKKGALIIVDYKVKILSKSSRETKEQFFGKKGWTLYSILIYTRKKDSLELNIKAHDHWSNDSRQDVFFTVSSLHAVIESMEKKPEWVTIILDNGGEAKTTIDSHHAQITYAINRYVKLGFDLSSGDDIEKAISEICGTSVFHLELNRKKGISNWFEWTWPIDGKYSGCICAREISNLHQEIFKDKYIRINL